MQVQRNYEAYMDAEVLTKGEADRAQLMKRRMAFERKVTSGIAAAARMLAKPFRGDSAASGDATTLFLSPQAPPPPLRNAVLTGDAALRAAAGANAAAAPAAGPVTDPPGHHASDKATLQVAPQPMGAVSGSLGAAEPAPVGGALLGAAEASGAPGAVLHEPVVDT